MHSTLKVKECEFVYGKVFEYFKYHAEQRMKSFNFFIIFQSITFSGIGAIFLKYFSTYVHKVKPANLLPENQSINTILISEPSLMFILLFLGSLVILLSFFFYHIDKRNKLMIDASREILLSLEAQSTIHKEYRIFNKVESMTNQSKCTIRHHHCIWSIYSIFALSGFLVFVYALHKILC